MSQFLLLLYSDYTEEREYSPEEMQNLVGSYGAWAQRLAEAGREVSGKKLCDDGGRVIEHRTEQVSVTDGPYAETKEVLGGFFIVEADSYDHAVEIARTCPHIDNGVKTMVREVEMMAGDGE